MSDIDLVVFDLSALVARDAPDDGTALLAETLSSLGLPIPLAEIESLGDRTRRDAIQELLLRYSPEQAQAETIDRLHADYSRRLKGFRPAPAARPLEGAEEVFRWLRQRGIKVVLASELDRKATNQLTASLRWNAGVVDAIVCGEDVKVGPPSPFLIFRAMELAGVVNVARVAVVSDKVRGLVAAATAGAAMNVGVLSGGNPGDQLAAADHTHLIESVRKLPSLFAAPADVPGPPSPPVAPSVPPAPRPSVANPTDPLGPGFTTGSKLE